MSIPLAMTSVLHNSCVWIHMVWYVRQERSRDEQRREEMRVIATNLNLTVAEHLDGVATLRHTHALVNGQRLEAVFFKGLR
jgi:hypothetical protein